MEEVSVIRTLSQAVSNTVKSPPVPSPASKSGRSDSTRNQTARVSEEGVADTTLARPSQKKVSLAEANEAVEDINRQLEIAHHSLRFLIDDETDEITVQVVDKETGKVVRVIPPEPSLSLLANGDLSGLFSVEA